MATTIRLIALFRITASSAANPNSADQQRQAELGTTQPDQPAENADACATDECTDAAFLCGHPSILPLFPVENYGTGAHVFRTAGFQRLMLMRSAGSGSPEEHESGALPANSTRLG